MSFIYFMNQMRLLNDNISNKRYSGPRPKIYGDLAICRQVDIAILNKPIDEEIILLQKRIEELKKLRIEE